ncbi:MAG: 2-amino-4-hydroxy-6-hydroxymethyldihydropteridine diphosphokinase / dihydropteroate synthase [Chloroflexota bacterium]|nr:2-amino-4-hydroxy-6-hydroxymethyldihydropteridine diphosphokinase / dihydropteroate synthase [Chloroflexota bacterium]
MPERVYLGTGSNLGDRLGNLNQAQAALAPHIRLLRASSVYETPPWGYDDQPAFLNQVLEVETDLEPQALLVRLKAIEAELGRVKNFRYGPRSIDLDILFYGKQVFQSETLNIPHPMLAERAFVLVPLAELAPGLMHPQLQRSVAELLAARPDAGEIVLYQPKPSTAWPKWGERTHVMGILNITPDSFSGDGLLQQSDPVEAALAQARQFVQDGATILDLGAESSRPGSNTVDAPTEIARIQPVLDALRQATLPAILSVDTYKAESAETCLRSGADWINDIWGLRADPQLAEVIAAHHAGVVIMHNRSSWQDVQNLGGLGKTYSGAHYEDIIDDIKGELGESLEIAAKAGIAQDKIILDPGIGFGKNVTDNLAILNRLDEIKKMGYPLLIGPSRKSFIGQVLDLPVEERLEGTAAAVALGIARGADIVRVHDVKEMARVAKMSDAIIGRNLPRA